MADEKDRFGDKLRDKERAQEDQFFAKRDRELIEKLRKGKEKEGEGAKPERAGSGDCPKCATPLKPREVHGISVDECPACGGVWMDRGELETLAGREEHPENWLARFLQISTRG